MKFSERYQRMRTTQAGILEGFLPAPDAALIKTLDEWQAEVEERLRVPERGTSLNTIVEGITLKDRGKE